MNALIDTCVVIDFLQARAPFAEDAREIMKNAVVENFSGYITAKSATDIFYLSHRCLHSNEAAREKLSQLLSFLYLADTAADDIYSALSSDISDFEDAVMIGTARRTRMDCIVTRNTKDYRKSSVPVYTPSEFLALLQEQTD